MWYYALNGEQHGPVEKNEIQRMVEEGILDGEDLVWTSGMNEWSEISTVEDVHPGPPSLPDEQTNLSSSYPPNEMQDRHTGTPGSDPGTYEPFLSPTDDSSAPLVTSSESGGNPAGAERVSDVTYAGFGRRLIAYIVDGLILFAFFMVLGAFVLASGGTSQDPPEGVLNFLFPGGLDVLRAEREHGQTSYVGQEADEPQGDGHEREQDRIWEGQRTNSPCRFRSRWYYSDGHAPGVDHRLDSRVHSVILGAEAEFGKKTSDQKPVVGFSAVGPG